MAVLYVTLPPDRAYELIREGICEKYASGELIDSHILSGNQAFTVYIGVFERFSWRNSNRMTMTVVCSGICQKENSGGGTSRTEVYFVASGAGNGLFGFDWGANESFEHAVEEILSPYFAD